MQKLRKDVAPADKWNVEALYADLAAWRKDFDAAKEATSSPHWPSLAAFKGRLGEGSAVLASCIKQMLLVERKLDQLYTYAHLRHDEDVAENDTKVAYDLAISLLHTFNEELSWFSPEILALPDSQMQAYLTDSSLAAYKGYLQRLVHMKPHVLPAEQEALMALAAKALSCPSKAFGALNNADLRFGKIKGPKGDDLEITHGQYQICLRDKNQQVRKDAFYAMHGKFGEFQNTMAELLSHQVEGHWFSAKARKYKTCLDAALYSKNVPCQVYHSLIHAVHENIDALHEYLLLRQDLMQLDTLHPYDLYVPLTAAPEGLMSYDEAQHLVIDSVAPLGADYQNALRKGLLQDNWVDRYENKNKRSGAYSSGCYDSMPYILMNFKGLLNDTFTLAHEVGHSMHSFLSRKHQSYQDSQYPIFVAEVASTFNEELLMQLMLKRAKTPQEKIRLINQKIEDIRATFFRQTMFAEFELKMHSLVEAGVPLTPSTISAEYGKINRFYFGKHVEIDDTACMEWARIPHFYYNYYVYQYATGISAALTLSERVLNGGKRELDDYLGFLQGGCSAYPIDLLKRAGADMTTKAPVESLLRQFRRLVQELSKLVKNEVASVR